ncbi:MAG: hypothetical protein VX083_13010 [Pseudomonadota bacterium]|jgi:hypothetical protein|uniref:Argininosuccinate lyase n=1 Tax=Thalassovita autumnalis TaxID=2072972 RepID=A0A0P1G3Z2_9RHOB|nr:MULTISPECIES: hypothetical protein [Thalassovita]MEC7962376.1 hypothetical protein [Pseudomonadota bacterium]MEC8039176.1 hypothetical protein [Pseudomonadota bacterium]MEC8294406.1 hypothetical protein [Pseudomonadota bacterium]CUH67511.1 hypothetical protein TL5118_02221 [Thalassovita autumnalis]CUH73919.1 hypothetical protein TL5120_03736 [Thalassovita autumnalis]|tara:strand:- start:134 stop:307 length:174 start_codon:yes stop_codon:yes gene_type:complete
MKPLLLTLGLLSLAACGIDGEPVKPTAGASVNIGTNGITTSAGVGVRKGPISIGIGL